MRSWGWLIRKFSRERSVWAPQYLSEGTWTSPKASVSVLVAAIVIDEAWKYLWVVWSDVREERAEERAVAPARGAAACDLGIAEFKHVLIALALPLGLTSQVLAVPEAHVRADESIVMIKVDK